MKRPHFGLCVSFLPVDRTRTVDFVRSRPNLHSLINLGPRWSKINKVPHTVSGYIP